MPNAQQNAFRKQGIFATYANIHEFSEDLHDLPQLFWDFYEGLFTTGIAGLAVGVEPYTESDGYHAHVLVHFVQRTSYTMESITFRGHRPNVSTTAKWYPKSICRLLKYVTKGDDVSLQLSNFPPQSGSSSPSRRNEVFRRAVDATSRREAEAILRQEAPLDYIKSYSNVQGFLQGQFAGDKNEYVSPQHEFDVPDEVTQWQEENLGLNVSNELPTMVNNRERFEGAALKRPLAPSNFHGGCFPIVGLLGLRSRAELRIFANCLLIFFLLDR